MMREREERREREKDERRESIRASDSKERRGLENTEDIQQRNLKRRNQKLVSSS